MTHSGYTEALAEEICEWLADGGTLRAYCRQAGKPSKTTVYAWLAANDEFKKSYDMAMLQGCHALLDETIEIADDTSQDYIEGKDGPIFNAEHVQRSKLRIHARHELIKRKRPDVFSDKRQLEHSGPGGQPIETVTRYVLADLE